MQKLADFVSPILSSNTEHNFSILDDKIGQLFGYRSTDLFMLRWWLFTVGDAYLFQLFILFVTLWYLCSFIRCRKNNASII